MPVLCALGWHNAEPMARWNDGYYFSRCRRCGRDLVRTLYGRWEVPRGFRVVWQAERPKSHVSPQLIRELVEEAAGSRRSNAPTRAELPIQAVLSHLKEMEITGESCEPGNGSDGISANGATGGAAEPATSLAPASGDDAIVGAGGPLPDVEGEHEYLTLPAVASDEAPDCAAVEEEVEPAMADGEAPAAEATSAEATGSMPTEERPEPVATVEQRDDQPSEADAAVLPEPQPEPEPESDAGAEEVPPRRGSAFPDFMADWPANTDWEYVPSRRRGKPIEDPEGGQASFDAAAIVEAEGADESPVLDAAENSLTAEPPAAPEYVAFPEPVELVEPSEPVEQAEPSSSLPEPGPAQDDTEAKSVEHIVPGVAFLLARLPLFLLTITVAVLILMAILLTSVVMQEEDAGKAIATSSPAVGPAPPATYVTASVVNCRAAPAREAAPVRRLGRGTEVALLGRDGEWASVAFRREQCWMLGRYIAAYPPA